MRIFDIGSEGVHESDSLQSLQLRGLGAQGFVWIACERNEFEASLGPLQSMLKDICGLKLLDLHVTDLLNAQLPSHYDYTSEYDILVFRRLAAGHLGSDSQHAEPTPNRAGKRSGPPILRRIDTSPVGFAVMDRVLLTVHPSDCAVRDGYAAKLTQSSNAKSHAAGAHLPTSPADLMLRVINHMVDGYLALRRELTRQLDHWQAQLLNPQSRFHNWSSVLDARLALHHLDEVCEEQRSSIQDWIEALKTWPEPQTAAANRERELLQVRSRDVLEHIERVVRHVRRLEQNAEIAVQIHFSAESHRTNDTMRTLTALTAVFLPLNLMAGIFGMNFEVMPLLHLEYGFWWAMGGMLLTALGLMAYFWRKHYISLAQR
jgi:Mg2+ and Co2+ transporter CorA